MILQSPKNKLILWRDVLRNVALHIFLAQSLSNHHLENERATQTYIESRAIQARTFSWYVWACGEPESV